jgi:hypothetical protein
MQIYALQFISRSVMFFESREDAERVAATYGAACVPTLTVIDVIPTGSMSEKEAND